MIYFLLPVTISDLSGICNCGRRNDSLAGMLDVGIPHQLIVAMAHMFFTKRASMTFLYAMESLTRGILCRFQAGSFVVHLFASAMVVIDAVFLDTLT
jgi:hypothetical protein